MGTREKSKYIVLLRKDIYTLQWGVIACPWTTWTCLTVLSPRSGPWSCLCPGLQWWKLSFHLSSFLLISFRWESREIYLFPLDCSIDYLCLDDRLYQLAALYQLASGLNSTWPPKMAGLNSMLLAMSFRYIKIDWTSTLWIYLNIRGTWYQYSC